jgi:hypothetical protein
LEYLTMNIPSIRTLMQIKDVTREDAVKVRAILKLKNVDAVTSVSDVALEYVRSCYHRPPLHMAKLTAIDAVIGTYGVEGIGRGHNLKSPSIEYCNAGDAYATTLLWVGGRYRVGDWGSIVERGNYD